MILLWLGLGPEPGSVLCRAQSFCTGLAAVVTAMAQTPRKGGKGRGWAKSPMALTANVANILVSWGLPLVMSLWFKLANLTWKRNVHWVFVWFGTTVMTLKLQGLK